MSVRAQGREYIVVFPSETAAQGLLLEQTQLQSNLSTETRKVVDLTQDQIEELKTEVPGVVIAPNDDIHVPSPEEMQALNPRRSIFERILDVIEPGTSTGAHGATKLHEQGIKGNSSPYAPIVVTVDTGVAAHQDFQPAERGLKFYDVFDKQEEAWNDGHSHGTHVTGIMLANGSRVTGMAPDARFIGIKVLDDSGNGTDASVISGLEKAAEYYDAMCKDTGRTMVVNLSLGDDPRPIADDIMHKSIAKILEGRPGLALSFAAGNSGPGKNTIGTPATFIHPKVTAVAAADTRNTPTLEDDRATFFSSRGGDKLTHGQDALRQGGMMADGNNVLSTIRENQYTRYSGTSMASPHEAGGIALLWDLAGKLYAEGKLKVTPQEINPLELLRETAFDHPSIDADTEGRGELAVDKAAELLVQRYGKEPEPQPQPEPTPPTESAPGCTC